MSISCDLEALVLSRVKRANTQLQALKVLQGRDKEVTSMTEELSQNLNKLKFDISELRAVFADYKRQHNALVEQQSDVEKLVTRIEYLENNIPEHFTSQTTVSKHLLSNGCAGDNGISSRPALSEKRNGAITNGTHSHILNTQSSQGTAFASNCKAEPETQLFCRLVKELTQEEFDNMPSYLKGRAMLTYATVTKFINFINKALIDKYRIVNAPRTVRERQTAKRYRSEETKDTKGIYFVTEGDIKESLNNLYSHNAQQSIWGILRSFQRTREIRGGGLVRFAVIVPEGTL